MHILAFVDFSDKKRLNSFAKDIIMRAINFVVLQHLSFRHHDIKKKQENKEKGR